MVGKPTVPPHLRHEAYRGSKPDPEIKRRLVPCALGCGKSFATVAAAAMHERDYHRKALKELAHER